MLTIVVPTYNRAFLLARALRSLTRQEGGCPAEIIVVDNNSGDNTREVAEQFGGRVRYVLEARQGLSHARNAGIAAATGEIVAFTDDDVEVTPDWMATIVREFGAHPEVDCIGGRVVPRWAAAPPAWLTEVHWGPLGLQDHGEAPREFDRSTPLCLIGANVAFRRTVFDRVGLFAVDVQRVRDGIGSTEDHEFLRRLYAAGGRARYVPHLVAHAEVPPERMTIGYHRRWHRGHGRFQALMRLPELEHTRRGRVFGVPAHLYRAAVGDLAAWVRLRLRGNATDAFTPETRLWFFTGFFTERFACLPRR